MNSKLGSIDEAVPVRFFLNINPNVRRRAQKMLRFLLEDQWADEHH